MSEEKDFFYTTTVDLSIARMYNSRKCKECHGKGYFAAYLPGDGVQFRKGITNHKTYTYCKCVTRNMKLYG